jgi:hypothetical protein
MTTEELERDLMLLAEPRATDERLRSATRAHLAEQMLLRPKRRALPRFAFGWAAVAAGAAAFAVVSLVGPSGSGGPSAANAAIIHHALRSLALPANAIVHVKEVGVDNGQAVGVEWWQQTDAPHALRMIKGPVGRQIEGANDGSTSFQYEPATNTVVETPSSSPPTLVDPIAGVRKQLASGDAEVLGTTTIDGHALYKIKLATGMVGYFDTNDYRPMYLDNPQHDGRVVRTRVLAYEELPMNAENAKLLSIEAQHPQARAVRRAAPSKTG